MLLACFAYINSLCKDLIIINNYKNRKYINIILPHKKKNIKCFLVKELCKHNNYHNKFYNIVIHMNVYNFVNVISIKF